VGGVRPIRRVAKLLSGFVALTIYGMAYRLWPAMKKLPLALAQFWITVIGSARVIAASIAWKARFGRKGPLADLLEADRHLIED
jgi:hypothetical protein